MNVCPDQSVWVPYEILPLCSVSLFADIGREEKAFIFINNGMRATENQELDFPPFQDESSAVHKKQIKIVKNVIYFALQTCTPPK